MKTINVVGTGPGSAFAIEYLAQTEKYIVNVFDVGSINDNDESNSKYKLKSFFTGKDFKTKTTRAFGFGGTSNLWHGVITKFDDVDWIEAFPNLPSIQQEISRTYDELDPYFSDLAPIINKEVNKFYNSPFSKKNKFSYLKEKNFYIQREPLRTKNIYKSLHEKGLINLFENSVALSLIDCHQDKKNVKYLTYFHNNEVKKIRGDIFIISAGSLETPRIFLQSIKDGSYNFGSEYIGKNLIDHPWTIIGTLHSKKPISIKHFQCKSKNLSSRKSHNIEIINKGKLKNHNLQYKPFQFGNFMKIKEIMTHLIVSRSFGTWKEVIQKHSFIDIFSACLYLISEKYNLTFLNFKSAIYIFMDQDFNKNSFIKLSEKKDQFNRLIPEINWNHGKREQEELKIVSDIIKHEYKNKSTFVYKDSPQCWSDLSSGSHHGGTMKIGMNEKDSVVDKDLKIHNKENIYVCDLSIFPRFGNSNPTYTLSAFSLRLGKHIAKKFSS